MPTTPPLPSAIPPPPPQPLPLATLTSTSPLTSPLTSPPSTPSPLRHPLRATKKLEHATHIRAAKTEILSHLREDWTYPPPPTSSPTHPRNRTTSIDTTWRERESDSSPAHSPTPPDPEHDPYRFENPDALITIAAQRSLKRKRAVRDEATHNPGLGTFIHRRDLWTGAVVMPVSPPSSSDEAPDPPTLVPVPPPLVPRSNAVRAAITPAAYPSIYSKIVVQGLAPTIPVNLGDVVRAMVEGWRREGEWPPKSKEGVEEEEGRVRRGMGRVKRVFGMGEKEGEGEGEGDEG